MSVTKAQRRKASKQRRREKARQKATNIRRNNQPPEKWVLQVLLNGRWSEAKRFRTWRAVEAHREETERLRKKGDHIVPGKVFNLETGREVISIEGSDKAEMKGASVGSDKAEDKARPGFLKRMVGHGNGS